MQQVSSQHHRSAADGQEVDETLTALLRSNVQRKCEGLFQSGYQWPAEFDDLCYFLNQESEGHQGLTRFLSENCPIASVPDLCDKLTRFILQLYRAYRRQHKAWGEAVAYFRLMQTHVERCSRRLEAGEADKAGDGPSHVRFTVAALDVRDQQTDEKKSARVNLYLDGQRHHQCYPRPSSRYSHAGQSSESQLRPSTGVLVIGPADDQISIEVEIIPDEPPPRADQLGSPVPSLHDPRPSSGHKKKGAAAAAAASVKTGRDSPEPEGEEGNTPTLRAAILPAGSSSTQPPSSSSADEASPTSPPVLYYHIGEKDGREGRRTMHRGADLVRVDDATRLEEEPRDWWENNGRRGDFLTPLDSSRSSQPVRFPDGSFTRRVRGAGEGTQEVEGGLVYERDFTLDWFIEQVSLHGNYHVIQVTELCPKAPPATGEYIVLMSASFETTLQSNFLERMAEVSRRSLNRYESRAQEEAAQLRRVTTELTDTLRPFDLTLHATDGIIPTPPSPAPAPPMLLNDGHPPSMSRPLPAIQDQSPNLQVRRAMTRSAQRGMCGCYCSSMACGAGDDSPGVHKRTIYVRSSPQRTRKKKSSPVMKREAREPAICVSPGQVTRASVSLHGENDSQLVTLPIEVSVSVAQSDLTQSPTQQSPERRPRPGDCALCVVQ
ncbi:unnamed protein product [Vitrella brassicaformis CCMP3155]|uniref:Uncharacterized protein n=1 Tax=Vitrella brassicaformis (strain CCMP3155) TaxID=1169540 RepID=A0A0G4EBY1_VITBC|nr:unnamed protein product [Vitrella brassicaformis CCMP3155]|eukprot:CEL92819.1 unnamed protein product [Vitrella brassicaformis CCMP3155]